MIEIISWSKRHCLGGLELKYDRNYAKTSERRRKKQISKNECKTRKCSFKEKKEMVFVN